MAKLSFDDGDGVWRTIGGRRVFIREGESLSSAMKRSGKFKTHKQETENKLKEGRKKLAQSYNDEELEKEIKGYEKTGSDNDRLNELKEEQQSRKKDSNEVKELKQVSENSYVPIREGEKEEDVMKAYNERQKKYRANLEPEVSKNLMDPRRLWDQDLVDTYIEMNEKGMFTGKDKDKFTRDMKNMEGKPLYSPERIKQNNEMKEINNKIANNKTLTEEEFTKKIREIQSRPSYKQKMDEAVSELNKKYGESKETTPKNNWQEQIKANNAKMEKDVTNLQNKINEYRNRSINAKDGLEKYQLLKEADKLQNQYYERFRENERANAKIKVEEPNEKYMNIDAYAGYKEKFNNTWGDDGSNDKVVSAKMYTNDEFMEHLEDANWHSERKQLLEANLTNQELAYIKDKTKVSAWGVENLTGKEQVDKLIKEAKSQNNSISNALRQKAYQKYLKEHPASKITFNDFKDMMNYKK